MTLGLGDARVWIVTPAEAERRLDATLSGPHTEPRPIALTVTVRDLAATKAYLDSAGIAHAPFARRSILVGPASTHGVYLEFIQPQAATGNMRQARICIPRLPNR